MMTSSPKTNLSTDYRLPFKSPTFSKKKLDHTLYFRMQLQRKCSKKINGEIEQKNGQKFSHYKPLKISLNKKTNQSTKKYETGKSRQKFVMKNDKKQKVLPFVKEEKKEVVKDFQNFRTNFFRNKVKSFYENKGKRVLNKTNKSEGILKSMMETINTVQNEEFIPIAKPKEIHVSPKTKQKRNICSKKTFRLSQCKTFDLDDLSLESDRLCFTDRPSTQNGNYKLFSKFNRTIDEPWRKKEDLIRPWSGAKNYQELYQDGFNNNP